MTSPAASGVRMTWEQVPRPVRTAMEQELGAPVVAAASQPGGFSPGVAARVRLADGTRRFVKAACATPNPDTPQIHRREIRIAEALPPDVPAPRLRFAYDDGEWVALVFDDIEGRPPRLPWARSELERVLATLSEMADALTPSPVDAAVAGVRLAPIFHGWSSFAAASVPPPADVEGHLDELVALEAAFPEAIAGDALVHLDVRADNLLLTDDRVFVVDWPWASVGAPWIDLVAMLPSVAMQGGPPPETVWRTHPFARRADADQVDAFLAAVAGMFSWQGALPPSPGLPTLRAFQSEQGVHARAWLAARRGWS